MHIAPLIVMMNAKTHEEKSAVAQALMTSYLPRIKVAQSMTLSAISAINAVNSSRVRDERHYLRGASDALEAILDEEKNELINQVPQKVQEKVLAVKQKIEKAALCDKQNEELVGLAESNRDIEHQFKISKQQLEQASVKIKQLTSDNRYCKNNSVDDQEFKRLIIAEVGQLATMLRAKPRSHYLTVAELNSLPIIEENLNNFGSLKSIIGHKKINKQHNKEEG